MSDLSSKMTNVLKNIDFTRQAIRNSRGINIVAVVSGTEQDRLYWQKHLDESKKSFFNADGHCEVISLQEKVGNKRKAGNFLGTLLAFEKISQIAKKHQVDVRGEVALVGMLFGRGERISPFTQIKGNRKPAISVKSPRLTPKPSEGLTAIEEALQFFAPLAGLLQNSGFRGVLCKWGDETQIPSVDLTTFKTSRDFENWDVIKFVSVLEISEELARQKDWVALDDQHNMLAQMARNERQELVRQLEKWGIKAAPDGHYRAGISLGPVAVSYAFVDIARKIFAEEIVKEGVFIDFDPYFLMALTMDEQSGAEWERKVATDKELKALLGRVPGFFAKVQTLKKEFQKRHGRPLNVKTFDLGGQLWWSDIGQHAAMYEKNMFLNDRTEKGNIARRVENIPDDRDCNGNIIIDSYISPEVAVKDSVIIHSVVAGKGAVAGTVIKNSILGDIRADKAFIVDCVHTDTKLEERCGIYELIGGQPLSLPNGRRAGTVCLPEGPILLQVAEGTNLRDKEGNYNVPILGNALSFAQAYDMIGRLTPEKINALRVREKEKVLSQITKFIKAGDHDEMIEKIMAVHKAG